MVKRKNTTKVGDFLEERIYELFRIEIAADRFWAKKSYCKVFRKKGYYSKDRGADIVFDVSIEIFLPGATEYSSVVLIECKNYSHSVPIDDIEEFFSKVQQVAAANCKAVMASTASFQSGTRAFAKSKGVGLLRYFDPSDFKWELHRSPSATARSTPSDAAFFIADGLSRQDFRSQAFDLYLQSPARETNSLWDFVEDLVLDTSLTTTQVRRIANSRNRLVCQVPYLEKNELEGKSATILSQIGYSSGEVSLEEICLREKKRNKLNVITIAAPIEAGYSTPILGSIVFDPLEIRLYPQSIPNRGRDRFTLAHELAHHLLKHGQYLTRELCDEDDFALNRQTVADSSAIVRMEYQANYFAACLLMPRTNITKDFGRLVRKLEITDKGFGPLYVDNQPHNLQNYEQITSQLMKQYGVSQAAIAIRLQSLGLLRDDRTINELRSIQNILALP